MHLQESVKARSGSLTIIGISAILVVFHLQHALDDGENIRSILLGVLIPMSFALSVLAGGVWLWRQEMDGDYMLRVAIWCGLGALLMAAESSLLFLYQQAEGVNMSHQLYVSVNSASGGAVIGFIIGLYDSRQRSAQTKSNRLGRQLTVLNRVLRHDIRNAATVIQSNSQLLTENQTDTVDHAQTIQQQTARLIKLGEQAKTVEQLFQKNDAERETVDITSLAETCCEQVARNYPDADVDVSLPETRVVYAHPMVDSALKNVIENAVEHNEKQTPHVEIESADISQNGTNTVELRVADNGPGISDSEREILERGYETSLEHMSGLGLWLVSWIVKESGGEIRFEENQPEGSIVCLRFERAQSPASSTPTLSGAITAG